MNHLIEYSKEVAAAIRSNKPIVALESTIISHGMPYPKNVKTAMTCEEIIRKEGAVPATIAIINGKLKVGLSKEELDFLGKEGLKIAKTSRRDIAYNVAHKVNGATTVSATMYIANLAGIKVFATGGIGGVHRNAENTMDISADLEELAETSVCVVSAGIKLILDLGLTLEYLETKGVPVFGYQTSSLPGFYTRTTDFKVNFKADHPSDIAKVIKVKENLQLRGGMLVANPISEEDSMDPHVIEKAIKEAIIEMDQKAIRGKDQTPFLLGKIVELTNGASLESNIKLVYNNCKVAANIAIELDKLEG